MLEDDFTYVIRKAFKGLDLAPGEAASRAGLPENAVLAFSRGNFSADTARRLAPVLGLNPDALANHEHYLPKPLAQPFIHRLDLPFGEERVNAWLVWTDDTAILFDTGYEPTSCTVALDALGAPALDRVFVTHAHVDHIGGIPSFMMRGNILHGANIDNTLPMKPGDSIRCGSLTVRACDLSGHANPALGFHIEGLSAPRPRHRRRPLRRLHRRLRHPRALSTRPEPLAGSPHSPPRLHRPAPRPRPRHHPRRGTRKQSLPIRSADVSSVFSRLPRLHPEYA